MGSEPAAALPPDQDQHGHCPKCRVGTLIRVEHQESRRSYDRFFCPRCGASVEVFGDQPGPRAAEG
jgi:ribosomal protein S27AE